MESEYMPKYQYSLVDIKYVKENPEEYIIPDCIDACRILWSKNISTIQCSNLDDLNYRWIEIDSVGLSEENKKILYDKINSKEDGFSLGGLTHNPRIYVGDVGVEANRRLCSLAEMLLLQDTIDFSTVEEYLDDFKRTDGEHIILPTGEIIRNYNPQFEDATLKDALDANDAWILFIMEEGRVYYNRDALDTHINYLNQLNKGDRIKQ